MPGRSRWGLLAPSPLGLTGTNRDVAEQLLGLEEWLRRVPPLCTPRAALPNLVTLLLDPPFITAVLARGVVPGKTPLAVTPV